MPPLFNSFVSSKFYYFSYIAKFCTIFVILPFIVSCFKHVTYNIFIPFSAANLVKWFCVLFDYSTLIYSFNSSNAKSSVTLDRFTFFFPTLCLTFLFHFFLSSWGPSAECGLEIVDVKKMTPGLVSHLAVGFLCIYFLFNHISFHFLAC